MGTWPISGSSTRSSSQSCCFELVDVRLGWRQSASGIGRERRQVAGCRVRNGRQHASQRSATRAADPTRRGYEEGDATADHRSQITACSAVNVREVSREAGNVADAPGGDVGRCVATRIFCIGNLRPRNSLLGLRAQRELRRRSPGAGRGSRAGRGSYGVLGLVARRKGIVAGGDGVFLAYATVEPLDR